MPSVFRRLTASGCALTIWLLGLLALSPHLHAELHDDCCEPEHVCAITLFHSGTENPTAHAAVAPAPPVPRVEYRLRILSAAWRAWAPSRLPPSRGPPSV